MPLQGDLREFGVLEVFQLLEQQDKTGCLFLSVGGSRIEVYFCKGGIVGVVPDGLTPFEHLLKTLEKLGFLAETEQTRIRELYRKDLHGLPEILQQQKILERREMEFLLKEAIKEILFPLFSSRQGTFRFDPDRILSSEWALTEPLPVEPIILEGLRRKDEWPLLERRIGSFGAVPRRRFVPEDTDRPSWTERIWRFLRPHPLPPPEDLPDKSLFSPGSEELSPLETIVHDLIDGKRTVQEIIRVSSLGEYACCKALLDMQDRGRIRIDPKEERRPAGSVVRRLGLGRWVLSAGVLTAVFLCLSFFSRSVDITWVRQPTGEGGHAVYRLLNQHQRARVMRAVEVYRKEQGFVPSGLADLVRARLLREDDLALWGRYAFSYVGDPPEEFRLLIVPAH